MTAAISLLIWLVFFMGQWLRDLLGLVGIGVVTRIMGLLLSVLAMEMVLQGLKAVV